MLCVFDTLTCVDDGIIDSVFVAAKQRDERVKYILESDVIAEVKVVLTSVPQSRLPSVQLIAELVKSGITADSGAVHILSVLHRLDFLAADAL